MSLYKETGTNPFAACLPLLVQTPVFIALFRLIDQAAKTQPGYVHKNALISPEQALSVSQAKLLGTVQISATFLKNSGLLSVHILAALLVVAMTVTTFTTQ